MMFWRRKKTEPTPIQLTPEEEISLLLHHIEFDALREQNKALLQALETICKHANEAWAALDHDYHEVLAGNLGDAVDQARAAIAKAKGESAE